MQYVDEKEGRQPTATSNIKTTITWFTWVVWWCLLVSFLSELLEDVVRYFIFNKIDQVWLYIFGNGMMHAINLHHDIMFFCLILVILVGYYFVAVILEGETGWFCTHKSGKLEVFVSYVA